MCKLIPSALIFLSVFSPVALGNNALQIPLLAVVTDPATVRVLSVQPRGEYACAGNKQIPWREFTPAMVIPAVQDAAARAIDERYLEWGTTKYPHPNALGGVPHLPAACSDSGAIIYEHPILTNGLYAGGDPSVDRIFFVWRKTGTGPEATFCGVMTHVNGQNGGFTQCKWRLGREFQ